VKNIFSASEESPEVDPAFEQQASQQRGTLPVAPSCNPVLPAHPQVQINPMVERIAERSAPGSAVRSDLTYRWRK
jgi:hypothetical protein